MVHFYIATPVDFCAAADTLSVADRKKETLARARGDCDRRVLRGDSWVSGPWDLRAANRLRNFDVDRNDDDGFRAARTLLHLAP